MPLTKIQSRGTENVGAGSSNLIINGAMNVAQRGTSFTGVSSSAYQLDRFKTALGDTSARFTITQASSGLNGFPYSLKYDCTTAEASLGNGNARVFLHQRLEGQNLQQLKKGTSDAKSLTLSFYVKSNKTGTYICELKDIDNTRQISKAYTISSANTWEQKSITFEGDTTGAFDNDNAESLRVLWHLLAGTSYNPTSGGTLNTSWASNTDANRAVGNVNIGDSTDNTWEITGVQLEVGSQASDFQHEDVGTTLAKCFRYFYAVVPKGENIGYFASAWNYSSSTMVSILDHKVEMRSGPTVETNDGTNDFRFYRAGNADDFDDLSLSSPSSTKSTAFYNSTDISGTAGDAGALYINDTTNAFFYLKAEL
tara:strand:+ start:1015 stop:2118 length:1104 start_codon:yes stop_codon:yes gene_type:complete